MTEQQKQFRSAFNGYNREDVVHYLEYLNNKHNAQVAQLTNELEALRNKQETPEPGQTDQQLTDIQAENQEMKRQIADLEQRLEEAAAPQATPTDSELEAYRRAERVERVSRERAREVGRQTADALEKISVQIGQRFHELSDASDRMTEQLSQLQQAVSDSLQAIQDAAGMAQSLGADSEE